jgi:hypothetical protein
MGKGGNIPPTTKKVREKSCSWAPWSFSIFRIIGGLRGHERWAQGSPPIFQGMCPVFQRVTPYNPIGFPHHVVTLPHVLSGHPFRACSLYFRVHALYFQISPPTCSGLAPYIVVTPTAFRALLQCSHPVLQGALPMLLGPPLCISVPTPSGRACWTKCFKMLVPWEGFHSIMYFRDPKDLVSRFRPFMRCRTKKADGDTLAVAWPSKGLNFRLNNSAPK